MKRKVFILILFLLVISCRQLTVSTIKLANSIYIEDKGELLLKIGEISEKVEGYWQAPYNVDYKIIKYGDVNLEKINRKKEVPNDKVIYFIHGGAFVYGLTNIYRNLANYMLNINDNYDIIFINYSTYPKAFYPKANLEVLKGLEYVKNKYDKVYVLGDSAGGNLAVSTILQSIDENGYMPNGVILISPFLDISNNVKSRKENYSTDILMGSYNIYKQPSKYLGEKGYFEKEVNKKYKYISPIYAEIEKFPPTYIEVNSKEMLYDDSKIFYEKLLNKKIEANLLEVQDLYHVYQLNTYLQESKKSLIGIYEFLDKIGGKYE